MNAEDLSLAVPFGCSPSPPEMTAGVPYALIEDCRRGDAEAFHRLFLICKDRVYNIAYRFAGNAAEAGDITQRVFVTLFTQLRRFRHDAQFSTWLYRLVVNACLDEHRRRRRFAPLEALPRPAATAETPLEAHILRDELHRAVWRAVAELSPKLRLPVVLKYVEGLSYEDIAAALGCSKGTVASRLNRAHRALAGKLAHLRHVLD